MAKYLDVTDEGAFADFEVRPQPAMRPECTEKCPKCKGHGGWNLLLNAYSLHGKEDTPENRHLFAHFRAACNVCWSWGWVTPEEATGCVHDYEVGRNVGRCLNEWVCKKCQRTIVVDSSD